MGNPDDGLDRLGPDFLDKRFLYHRRALRVKRGSRFFFFIFIINKGSPHAGEVSGKGIDESMERRYGKGRTIE
jgi:hypothetical protein